MPTGEAGGLVEFERQRSKRTFIESFFPKPGKRAEKVEPAPV